MAISCRRRRGQPAMQKSSAHPLPSLSVRIDLDTEGRIGRGKIQLLENIQACGAISARGGPNRAGKNLVVENSPALGMDPAPGPGMGQAEKGAWDLVDEINRICK